MIKRRIFLIGFVGSVTAAGAVKGLSMAPKLGPAQRPIRAVNVAVPREKREKFFDQLRQFSDANDFAIRIAPITPDGEEFGADMYSDDIKILGTNALDREEFFFGFYQNGEKPISPASVEKLFEDLKQTVENVSGVVVSDAE